MKSFIKIYIWQFLSLISGFATMFIVTPFLSGNQSYFGIYTFVVSLGLFLSYADFGFLSAGVKFASEAYARNERKAEEKIFGFVLFVMSFFFLLFGLIVFRFYINPEFILKGLSNPDDILLAKELFLVFIISLPITLAHRIIQLIFSIRLEDYKYQRVYSILNLFKICLAFLFFKNNEYHIVGYYLFTQILTLVTIFIGVLISKKEYGYNYLNVLKYIGFNKETYIKTKSLAFNSLFVTLSWVIYYELDSLIIGRFVGLKEVAIFNICLTIMTLARSIYGIFYNPFMAKFNHYIGKGENDKLIEIFNKVLNFGLPFAVLPTIILVLSMKSFLFSWVGVIYEDAVPTAMIMFSSYILAFISYPAGLAMVAKSQIKQLYIVSAILPIIYWLGIVFTFKYYGIFAFGLWKFISFIITGAFYIYFSFKNLKVRWLVFVNDNLLGILASIFTVALLNYLLYSLFPYNKGSVSLIIYAVLFLLELVLGMIAYYLSTKRFRLLCSEITKGIFKK